MVLISVIIPTCHRNDLLALCLDRLAPGVQLLPADQYEVIVTDDGAKTTAEEMVRKQYPWARWVAGPRKGPAANRNNGANLATGEWLAFTDDDCLPTPEWLSAYAEIAVGNCLALEGAIHPLGDINRDMAECPVNLDGGWFWSANIAVKRDVFEKIGGFDTNYPLAAHEDVDLKFRLIKLTSILFVEQAKVFHPVRYVSLKCSIARISKTCRAWADHAKKNGSELGLNNDFEIIKYGVIFQLRALVNYIKQRKPKNAFLSFLTLTYGIAVIIKYLRGLGHASVNKCIAEL